MNLVLDTLKSRRSFLILGHALGILASAVAFYLVEGGVWAWKGAVFAAFALAIVECLIAVADPVARRLKTLAPNAFPFKNLAEADRKFLQKSVARIPKNAFRKAALVWWAIFWPAYFLADGEFRELGSWSFIAASLGMTISSFTQILGNSVMVRRILPFFYFEGDFPDELSRLLPSLRRKFLTLVGGPAFIVFYLPFAFSINGQVIPYTLWVWLLFWAVMGALGSLRVFNDIVVSPIEDLGSALGRFGDGDYTALLDVTSGDALGVTTNRYNKTVRKTDRRFFVREHFGHMVVGDKSEQLFEGGLKLDGEEREVAVIACRLSGEKMTLAAFNKFCTAVVECVEKHGGGIDQVSDGLIVALFNAPLKIENAEGEALEAAKEIKERLAVFVTQQKMQAGLQLQFGVGFAFGKALLGLVGPKGRQRYTALGSVVEEARRLCAL